MLLSAEPVDLPYPGRQLVDGLLEIAMKVPRFRLFLVTFTPPRLQGPQPLSIRTPGHMLPDMVDDTVSHSGEQQRLQGVGDDKGFPFFPEMDKKVVYNVPGLFKGGQAGCGIADQGRSISLVDGRKCLLVAGQKRLDQFLLMLIMFWFCRHGLYPSYFYSSTRDEYRIKGGKVGGSYDKDTKAPAAPLLILDQFYRFCKPSILHLQVIDPRQVTRGIEIHIPRSLTYYPALQLRPLCIIHSDQGLLSRIH